MHVGVHNVIETHCIWIAYSCYDTTLLNLIGVVVVLKPNAIFQLEPVHRGPA